MAETHILLVRHPETTANVDGRYVGRGDARFTSEGRLQLRRLPAKIAEFEPDRIWSSPLRRARVLSERAARLTGVPLKLDDRIVELDFGQAEGLTYAEIEAAGLTFDYRDPDAPVAPGGESRGDIERRTAAFCDELSSAGGRHAIITHGGVFRAALAHLLGLAPSGIWAFHIHNAQLGSVRVIDGHGMLEEYRRG